MHPSLYLLLAAIFWGLNFHFAAFMLGESSYIESAVWRYIFAVLPLIIFSLKSLRNINPQDIPLKGIVLVGFIGLFGFNVFFFWGLQYTSAINASLIISLNPMLTIWLSAILLKTRITLFQIIGAIVALIGVNFLLVEGKLSNLQYLNLSYGDLLIMAANVIFALHHIWIKKYKGNFSNLNFTTLTNLICLLSLVGLLIVSPHKISVQHKTEYWFWAMGIGTIGTAIAYLFWNAGVTKLGADKAGVFMNVVPLATGLSALFLGETLYSFHLISGGIILLGIGISRLKKMPFSRRSTVN